MTSMAKLDTRMDELEKKQIECSTSLSNTVTQLKQNQDEYIFTALDNQSKKINSLPWKIFGIVGGTITILLTVFLIIFQFSINGVQDQYEKFTTEIITLKINNIESKIDKYHGNKEMTYRGRSLPHRPKSMTYTPKSSTALTK
jgi:hypothetical protein